MKPVVRSSTNSNSRSELHYHINVLYSEEDGGWIAGIPDLVHCSAFEGTPRRPCRKFRSLSTLGHKFPHVF